MADNEETNENEGTEEEDAPEGQAFTAADRDNLQKALRAERKLHREAAARLTALEAEKMTDTEKDWSDKLAQATSAADNKLKMVAARSALTSAGLQGKPDRLVKLLDLSEVTVDDDGVLTGLDDQLSGLKAEFPALFASGTGQQPPGRLDVGGKPRPAAKAQTYAEKLAASIPGLS